jgi:glycosyltransferase involved in cell wall biosynthesis
MTTPLRIGFDASRLGVTQRTGTEHYSWELLSALAQIDHRNRYVLYANGLPRTLPPLPTNYELRSLPFGRMWTHARLSGEMLKAPPDILFVPAHVLPLWSPRRAVVTIHDLGYVHHPEAHPRTRRLYLRLSTRWNAWRATTVLADSEATKRDIIAHCGVGADKIRVVYLGVSARFRPITDTARLVATQARYGIHSPYVLFVGTIQPRKNLERLIEAWGMYLNQAGSHMERPTLVIAGKRGWLSEAIERRAHEQGIADRVQFIGYVDEDDLPTLISGARVYLFPSLYEGFGLPILEAQACGTPVLASNVSSLPEVGGDAALYVDPFEVTSIRDGIAQLLEDSALRDRLRGAGLRRVTDWTWERTARRTLETLEEAGRS